MTKDISDAFNEYVAEWIEPKYEEVFQEELKMCDKEIKDWKRYKKKLIETHKMPCSLSRSVREVAFENREKTSIKTIFERVRKQREADEEVLKEAEE